MTLFLFLPPPYSGRYLDAYDLLLDLVQKVDSSLHAELKAEIKKDLNSELSRQKPKAVRADVTGSPESLDKVLDKWVQQTMGNLNVSDPSEAFMPPSASVPSMSEADAQNFVKEFAANNRSFSNMTQAMIRFPSFLPIKMLPLMLRSTEISADDRASLKSIVFTADILKNVRVDDSSYLISFFGQPNTSLAATQAAIEQRISSVPGLSERVRVFALPSYGTEQNPHAQGLEQERFSGRKFAPVFTVLSKGAEPMKPGAIEYTVNVLALLTTFITCFIYAVDVNSLNADFLAQALAGDVTVVDKVIPIAVGLMALQGAHEVGHGIAALVHKTRISAGYFVPSLQIGLFGSIMNFRDFVKSRKELFDISISGPVLGFLASLVCTIYGLLLTQQATPEALATFPALPTGFFSSSFFLYELADQFLHIADAAASAAATAAATLPQATPGVVDPAAVVQLPAGSLTPLHPYAAIGLTGLLANAFNFMPIGRLDGGRVVMAIFGRQSAQSISFAALLGQGVSLLTNASPVTFFWLLVVVFLQRGQDLPPIDDVTPLSSPQDDEKKGVVWFGRLAAFLFCAVLTGAILLPIPIDPSTALQQASEATVQGTAGVLPGLNGIQI